MFEEGDGRWRVVKSEVRVDEELKVLKSNSVTWWHRGAPPGRPAPVPRSAIACSHRGHSRAGRSTQSTALTTPTHLEATDAKQSQGHRPDKYHGLARSLRAFS